jgi:soluble P-type ATPase
VPILIDIPGWRRLALFHLVLDLNGTVALDGALLPGVAQAVGRLAQSLECHLVTADTYGNAADLFGPGVTVQVIQPGNEGAQKLELVKRLGPDEVVALGNGANDAAMLGASALGIAVLGEEGAAREALNAADLVAPGPLAALQLLLKPDRLRATLRR